MNILLFILGALILYVLQALFFQAAWKKKLYLNVAFSQKQATEGDTAALFFTVENRKTLPLATLKVNIAVEKGLKFADDKNLAISDKNYRSEIFSMRGSERVKRELPFVCAKRGYYHIRSLECVGSDLFYTRQYFLRQPVSADFCVYPGKTDARRIFPVSRKLTGEAVVPRADCDDPFTFKGIRQYQPTDSIRDINWKASARTGELRVNVHEFTSDREIVILLDCDWDNLLKPEGLLEESIRITASMADIFLAQGIMTSLSSNACDCLTGERVRVAAGANASHIASVLYALARLELAETPDGGSAQELLEECINDVAAHSGRSTSFLLISTQTGNDLLETWRDLKQYAERAVWVFPTYQKDLATDQMLADPDIVLWEVPYGK